MKREQIEAYLRSGDTLNVVRELENYSTCEVTLVQETPNERFLSLIDPVESPSRYAEEMTKREKPYKVTLEIYATGADTSEMNPNEYIMHQIQRFSSIEDVDTYITQISGTLEEIKWDIYRNIGHS